MDLIAASIYSSGNISTVPSTQLCLAALASKFCLKGQHLGAESGGKEGVVTKQPLLGC